MGPASLQIELKSVRRVMMSVTTLLRFFSEPILGPPEWTFGRRNAKKSVKKVDSTRHVATNCAKPGSGTKPRQKSGSPSLESELKLSRRPSPEAQPAPRVHSSSVTTSLRRPSHRVNNENLALRAKLCFSSEPRDGRDPLFD